MLKLLSRLSQRLTGKQRPERLDAARIYAKIMKQSRNPVFYIDGFVEDNTDGRMEWLSAHLSVLLHALQNHGEDGAKLSQAIYDSMVDDFDVALREEGLSDSGVKHRIKPLAKMFLTRARTYAEALNANDGSLKTTIHKHVLQNRETTAQQIKLCEYLESFSRNVRVLPIDQIAAAQFNFPKYG